MVKTAKLFMNGRSQAVRLPLALRFEGDEVFIRQDPETGDVVLSSKPGGWADFFNGLDESAVPEDFMSERDNAPAQDRDLF